MAFYRTTGGNNIEKRSERARLTPELTLTSKECAQLSTLYKTCLTHPLPICVSIARQGLHSFDLCDVHSLIVLRLYTPSVERVGPKVASHNDSHFHHHYSPRYPHCSPRYVALSFAHPAHDETSRATEGSGTLLLKRRSPTYRQYPRGTILAERTPPHDATIRLQSRRIVPSGIL